MRNRLINLSAQPLGKALRHRRYRRAQFWAAVMGLTVGSAFDGPGIKAARTLVIGVRRSR